MGRLNYAEAYALRDTRPCDGCGKRARCAPCKRFGGMLCGTCSAGIAAAAQRVETSNPAPASPPTVRERRGVTQFKRSRAVCSVEAAQALESAYRAFRRFPSAETREQLMRAMDDRLSALAQ